MHPFDVPYVQDRCPMTNQYGCLTHEIKGIYKGLNVKYFKDDAVSSSWRVEKLAMQELIKLRLAWFKKFHWEDNFYLSGTRCLGEGSWQYHESCSICSGILFLRFRFDQIHEKNQSKMCLRVDSLFQTIFTAGIFYLHTLLDPGFRSYGWFSTHELHRRCRRFLGLMADEKSTQIERLKSLNKIISTLDIKCFKEPYPHLVGYLQRGLKVWRCDLLKELASPKLALTDTVKGNFKDSREDIKACLDTLYDDFKYLCESYRSKEAEKTLSIIHAASTNEERALASTIQKKQAVLHEMERLCSELKWDSQNVLQQKRFLKALEAMDTMHQVQGKLRPLPFFAKTILLLTLTLCEDFTNAFTVYSNTLKEYKPKLIEMLKKRKDILANGCEMLGPIEQALEGIFNVFYTDTFSDRYFYEYLVKKTLYSMGDLVYHSNTQILEDGNYLGLGPYALAEAHKTLDNGDIDPEDEFEKLITAKMGHAYMYPAGSSTNEEKRKEDLLVAENIKSTFRQMLPAGGKEWRRLQEHLRGYLRDSGGYERRTGQFCLMNVTWVDIKCWNNDPMLITEASRFIGVMNRTGHRLTKKIPCQFNPYRNVSYPNAIDQLLDVHSQMRVNALPFAITMQILEFMQEIQFQLNLFRIPINAAHNFGVLPGWLMNNVNAYRGSEYIEIYSKNANDIKQDLDEKLKKITLLSGKIVEGLLGQNFIRANLQKPFMSIYDKDKARFKDGYFGKDSLFELRNELSAAAEEEYKDNQLELKRWEDVTKVAFASLSELNYSLSYQMVVNAFRFIFEMNWWYQSMIITAGDILPEVNDLEVRQFGERNLKETNYILQYTFMKTLDPNHRVY